VRLRLREQQGPVVGSGAGGQTDSTSPRRRPALRPSGLAFGGAHASGSRHALQEAHQSGALFFPSVTRCRRLIKVVRCSVCPSPAAGSSSNWCVVLSVRPLLRPSRCRHRPRTSKSSSRWAPCVRLSVCLCARAVLLICPLRFAAGLPDEALRCFVWWQANEFAALSGLSVNVAASGLLNSTGHVQTESSGVLCCDWRSLRTSFRL
jgi:hypothetical protein